MSSTLSRRQCPSRPIPRPGNRADSSCWSTAALRCSAAGDAGAGLHADVIDDFKDQLLIALLRRLGSKVDVMDAAHHDRVLAVTSHLPHLIAYTIVGTASDLEDVTQSEVIKYSAGGFRDFTRIASSSPEMWHDIVRANAGEVLQILKAQIAQLQQMQQLIEQAQARGIDAVKRPQAVSGLQPTATARTFYFDPSFTLDRNITDSRGQLLFAAGTRKNPLDVVSLSKHLLFFDARDRRQVTRAHELIARYAGKVKPILVGGSYLDLMKRWNKPVFYDQEGALVRKFGIAAVPASVSQEGQRLRTDEVPVR